MANPIWRTRILKNRYMKIDIWWFCKSLIIYTVITIVELKIADPMPWITNKCTHNDDFSIIHSVLRGGILIRVTLNHHSVTFTIHRYFLHRFFFLSNYLVLYFKICQFFFIFNDFFKVFICIKHFYKHRKNIFSIVGTLLS